MAHQQHTSGAMRENMSERYDLIPFKEFVQSYMRVSEYGAKKYDTWNWSKGLPQMQVAASLLRHLWAYMRGEDKDQESGLHHVDHVVWNAVTLCHHVFWGIEDDRRSEPERDYSTKPSPIRAQTKHYIFKKGLGDIPPNPMYGFDDEAVTTFGPLNDTPNSSVGDVDTDF